jgi:hypothetical protein
VTAIAERVIGTVLSEVGRNLLSAEQFDVCVNSVASAYRIRIVVAYKTSFTRDFQFKKRWNIFVLIEACKR